MRSFLIGALRARLARRSAPLPPCELKQHAIVFAPHPDDETLGCGGSIRIRREAGGRVQVAFLTDGAASHAHVSRRELSDMRRQEALEAASVLGVEEREVYFFGFPDGDLSSHHTHATERVRALLRLHEPDVIYVPHREDGPADHRVTTQVVLDAARDARPRVTVFEYPVWLWHSFPWVGANVGRGLIADVLTQRRLFRELSTVVPLHGTHATKLRALDCYVSQMAAPRGARRWATLGDVAGGDFLRALLTDHEYFHRYELYEGRAMRRGER